MLVLAEQTHNSLDPLLDPSCGGIVLFDEFLDAMDVIECAPKPNDFHALLGLCLRQRQFVPGSERIEPALNVLMGNSWRPGFKLSTPVFDELHLPCIEIDVTLYC